MSEYDIGALNDKEFEGLTLDILEVDLGHRIERFKPGRDWGIDGRISYDSGKGLIVQCKHYSRSSLSALLGKIKKEEKPKADKLSPCRYILVTSLGLSPANKKEIRDAFGGHIKRDEDVWGADDIESALRANENIVRRHHRLWIRSSAQLSAILHSAEINATKTMVDEAYAVAALYAKTAFHSLAVEQLRERRLAVIAGDPGVGKTTLAEQVVLDFISEGYQPVCVSGSLLEAERLYQADQKQIFLYDDFWGHTELQIPTNEDTQLARFAAKIARSKIHCMVLTSRTTIVNRARLVSERYLNCQLSENEYLISVKDLSRRDRARILYNHVCKSDLLPEYIDKVYEDKRYLKIIDHGNFNPRVIAFLLTKKRVDVAAENYWDFIERRLKCPAEIWTPVYERHLEDSDRLLVVTVALFGQGADETKAELAFSLTDRRKDLAKSSQERFRDSVVLAAKSMLNRVVFMGRARITVFNPSIIDFVHGKIRDDMSVAERVGLAPFREIISNCISASDADKLSERFLDAFIKVALANYCYLGPTNGVESACMLISRCCSVDRLMKNIPGLLDFIHEKSNAHDLDGIYTFCAVQALADCISLALEDRDLLEKAIAVLLPIVLRIDDDPSTDMDDINTLSKAVETIRCSELKAAAQKPIGEYISSALPHYATDIVLQGDGIDDLTFDYDFDEDGAIPSDAYDLATNALERALGPAARLMSNQDLAKVAMDVDMHDIIKDNEARMAKEDNAYDEWRDRQAEERGSEMEELEYIDDLFDRS